MTGSRPQVIAGVDPDGNPRAIAVNSDRSLKFSASAPTSAYVLGITTSTTGTNFVAFEDYACTSLEIVNDSITAIEYKYSGQTLTIKIPSNTFRVIPAITNANQISIKRVDSSNTSVTFKAIAYN